MSVVVGSGDSEGLSQVGIARHIGDGVVELCLNPNIVNIVVVEVVKQSRCNCKGIGLGASTRYGSLAEIVPGSIKISIARAYGYTANSKSRSTRVCAKYLLTILIT